MKKFAQKIIFLMSMALLFVTIPFALTACDSGKHEHSFSPWQEGSPATCYSSGQRGYYFCTKCGKMFDADRTTEIYDTYIPMAEHTLEYRPEEPATCSNAGHTEYWECTDCNSIFMDEYGHHEADEWYIRIEPTREHILVKAHDYVEPTCTTAGTIEYWECQTCHEWFYSDDPDNQIFNKNNVIIPAQHTAPTHHREYSAGCTTNGTIEYWECGDCGKKFSDNNYTKEITSDDDLVIPATGHRTTYVEAKENTHTTSGCIEHWKCTRCYGTFADREATTSVNATIPAGHCFGENGLCKYCDQEEYSAGLTFELIKDSDTYKVSCKKFTQGDLVIPAKYIEPKVGAVAKNVTHIVNANDNASITSVTIPKTITTVGADVFKNCTGLTAVYYKGTLEDWVKISFGSIYSNPLYYAKNLYLLDEKTGEYNLLTTATLSGNNSIGAYAFAGCTSLTSITVSNNSSIGASALAGCTNLESITLPFYTPAHLFGETTPSKLKTINYTQANGKTKLDSNTFSSQYGTVENITIPDGITIINYDTFKYFTNLKTIILPDTITELYRSFSNCTNLQYNQYNNGLYLGTEDNKYAYLIKATSTGITSLTIHTECLAVSSYALEGCTSLKSLTTPFFARSLAKVDTDDASSVKLWFGDSSTGKIPSIETLKFSKDSVQTVNVNIPLTSITLPSSVKNVTLRSCQLTNLIIPDSTTSLIVYSTHVKNLTMPWINNLASIVSALYAQNLTITTNNSTTAIPDSFFSEITSLETIVLPSGIKTIGEYAFSGCTGLNNINLPNSVKSIGEYAFKNCTALASTTVPNGVTSLENGIFYCCTALESVTIGNNVTSIGEKAFYYCTALESVTIPNSVTSIGKDAFYDCRSLESVTISNSVTSIGESTFYNCRNLTSINIPNSVTNIAKDAFSGCTSLTSITIPTSVTNIESYAFTSCRALTIYCEAESQPTEWGSNWNATSLSSEPYCPVVWNCNSNDVATDENIYTVVNGIRYAIKNGTATLARQPSNLTDVVLPSSISYKDSTYNVTSISEEAFSSCTALTSIIIGDNITSIGEKAFYNCTALTNITIGNNVTSIGAWAFYDCTALTNITIGNNVKSIGAWAFYRCSALTTITISSSVTSIGEKAFYNCTALARVNYFGTIDQWTQITFGSEYSNPLPYAKEGLFINDTLVTELNFTTATTICNFENYDKLTSVTMGDSVTRIGAYAFSGCTALTNITIGNSVTSIGSYAFKNCTALPNITIPSSVTSIESYAFTGCTAITRVNYLGTINQWAQINFKTTPANPLFYATEGLFINDQLVTEINLTTATTIGSYAFANYHKLTSVTIGDSVTSIGEHAFYNCTALASITIGDNVTSIGEYAFSSCTALASITIPNSVTKIGEYAFSGCTALNTVTIGSGVTRVKDRAFYDCFALTRVNYSGTINQWARINFNDGSSNPLSYATEGLFINDKLVTTANLTTTTTIGSSAFAGYNKLTSVTIGNSVTSIGEYAFSGCNALTSVTIPTSVRYIDKYALSCNALTIYCKEKTQPVGWKSYWSYYADVVWDCDNNDVAEDGYIYTIIDGIRYRLKNSNAYVTNQPTTITSADIPSTISYNGSTYNVTSIGSYAFENCTALTSVTIPSSVTSIGSHAFSGCTALTSITIPNGVTSLENGIFYGCVALTSITIPNSVTSIGKSTFSGCTALECVTIPNSVTSIGEKAFYNCTALTSITIPNSVTSIGEEAFYNCTALTINCEATSKPSGWNTYWNGSGAIVWDCDNNNVAENGYIYTIISGIRYKLKDNEASVAEQPTTITSADIPSTISYNGSTYNVTSIGGYAFRGCTALESVTIPNSVTSIGIYAFRGCTALTSITIPNGVTSLENGIFYGCVALTSITIPNSVTSIGTSTFYGCTTLESVTIPSSVTSIRFGAFDNCTALTINCEATSKPSGWYTDWNNSDRPVVWGYTAD